MSFDPSKRPSFDEILEEMFRHAFKIASEVDSGIVTCRYRYLNRYRAYKRRMQLSTVTNPSQNIGNRRPIKKPIIKKPI
ncbi:hypothetical protein M9Y10_020874 [Tritrichomonas musculus]|uniref:Uncharacterized protein n=1 Tax=Tritrichomonas musculus TaxID=1915356 RepID=A0ABR2HGT3_9EUKA